MDRARGFGVGVGVGFSLLGSDRDQDSESEKMWARREQGGREKGTKIMIGPRTLTDSLPPSLSLSHSLAVE